MSLHEKDTMYLRVPIVSFGPGGGLRASPAFHRSYDRLHSRSIEYPFGAWKLPSPLGKILDVGSTKGASIWIDWLASLNCELYLTDFDTPANSTIGHEIVQADVRSLPFSDDSFDAITAISVVEHIGLPSCQVNGPTQPSVDEFGDGNAVKELIRVLKPGGTLIITVPLGKSHKILGGDARCYSPETLHRLTGVGGRLTTVTYFEYQHRDSASYFDENEKYKPPVKPGLYLRIKRRLRRMFSAQAKPMVEDHIGAGVAANLPQLEDFSDEFGSVVWRERPITDVNALNETHIDGVTGIVLSK